MYLFPHPLSQSQPWFDLYLPIFAMVSLHNWRQNEVGMEEIYVAKKTIKLCENTRAHIDPHFLELSSQLTYSLPPRSKHQETR